MFWSQLAASQLAASAAACEPPITKPKKRGPAIAVVAGDTVSSSNASVSARVARLLGQCLVESLQPRHGGGARGHGSLADVLEIGRGAGRGILEQRGARAVSIAHDCCFARLRGAALLRAPCSFAARACIARFTMRVIKVTGSGWSSGNCTEPRLLV